MYRGSYLLCIVLCNREGDVRCVRSTRPLIILLVRARPFTIGCRPPSLAVAPSRHLCSKACMETAEVMHARPLFYRSDCCRPPSTAPSSRKGSVGSGSSSLLAALAAERDAAADFEAAEESAAERVAGEVRSFFNNIPRVRY